MRVPIGKIEQFRDERRDCYFADERECATRETRAEYRVTPEAGAKYWDVCQVHVGNAVFEAVVATHIGP